MDRGKLLMADPFNKKAAEEFWSNRALMKESRWTTSNFLEFEKTLIQGFLPPNPITILDLGCGSGQLSKAVKRPNDKLIAVDKQVNFKRFFDVQNTKFIECDVIEYKFNTQVDFILLFGVINYLTNKDITELFNNILNSPNPNFQLIIKAQFALEKEYEFDKFSDALNFQYSARYPRFDSFVKTLSILGKDIDIIDYPSEFQQRDNFSHKAIRIYEK
jgi:SAM-dependent methyltransferase